VVPRAVGAASRLKQEAEGYRASIVAQAQGDAQRFKSLLAEYQKAPQVTRDRLYLENMQQVFSGVTKVLVDTKQGSNLLYLPLDQIMQVTAAPNRAPGAPEVPAAMNSTPPAIPSSGSGDLRGRDDRGRDRDARQ